MKRICIALTVLANSMLLLPAQAEEEASKPQADPSKVFAKMDANSDGTVTKEEFMASPKGKKDPEKAAKKFGKMDTDANGSLSLDEFKAGAAKKGKNADKPAKDEGGSDE